MKTRSALSLAAVAALLSTAPLRLNAQTQTTLAPASATTAPLPPVPAHKHLHIAIYQGPGASDDAAAGLPMKALLKDPDVDVKPVTPDDIRAGKLAGYDILVQPGGSGGGQGRALGDAGRDRIRDFVRNGGGYIGICGGSYLATCDYPWSLGILNARVVDKAHWARGHGPVDVAFTPDGKKELAPGSDDLSIIYWQGPLLAPAGDAKLPPYQEWATFHSEVTRKGVPGGVMQGTTAIAAGVYGKGHVVCFSPHPEKTPGQEPLLHRALLWITGNAPTSTAKVAPETSHS